MNIIEVSDATIWRRTEPSAKDLKRLIFDVARRRHRPAARRRVLDSVTLQISRGEKVGVIGPNGAGKSTLLKLICGILQPSSGTARVNGCISPLIELGAGFDSDLNLIDNIVYYGILLGHSRREMLSRVESILDFAELR